jgi:hypothetical protein
MNRTITLFLLILLGTGACSPTRPAYKVQGVVTLDGSVVPGAQLQFTPEDQTQGAGFARSDENGAYQTSLPAGDYTVRILAQKRMPAPPRPPGPGRRPIQNISVDIIPPRYNTKTELRLSITGPTEQNFPLTSAVPGPS